MCDFTIIDMEVLESTQSMILQVNNEEGKEQLRRDEVFSCFFYGHCV